MTRCATWLAAALLTVSCAGGLAERYAAGNKALSVGDGPVYAVVIAPVLQGALNDCIPAGTDGAARVLMVLADIDAAGRATEIVIEPESPGTGCVRQRLEAAEFHPPPLRPGQASFPIGLRIETAP